MSVVECLLWLDKKFHESHFFRDHIILDPILRYQMMEKPQQRGKREGIHEQQLPAPFTQGILHAFA